jgi:hypothetical protein
VVGAVACVSRYSRQLIALLLLLALTLYLLSYGLEVVQATNKEELFSGYHWINPGQTIEAVQLLNSKYLRLESHTVRRASGQGLIKGWIWVDFHDRVDVLVQDEKHRFVVLKQDRYGVEGSTMAVLSRMLGDDENPLAVAKDLVRESTGREAKQWLYLGEYRTDANRGGGYVYCYLALRSRTVQRPVPLQAEDGTMMSVEFKELVSMTIQGQFREVKWSNTVSLALLRLLTHSEIDLQPPSRILAANHTAQELLEQQQKEQQQQQQQQQLQQHQLLQKDVESAAALP